MTEIKTLTNEKATHVSVCQWDAVNLSRKRETESAKRHRKKKREGYRDSFGYRIIINEEKYRGKERDRERGKERDRDRGK